MNDQKFYFIEAVENGGRRAGFEALRKYSFSSFLEAYDFLTRYAYEWHSDRPRFAAVARVSDNIALKSVCTCGARVITDEYWNARRDQFAQNVANIIL